MAARRVDDEIVWRPAGSPGEPATAANTRGTTEHGPTEKRRAVPGHRSPDRSRLRTPQSRCSAIGGPRRRGTSRWTGTRVGKRRGDAVLMSAIGPTLLDAARAYRCVTAICGNLKPAQRAAVGGQCEQVRISARECPQAGR